MNIDHNSRFAGPIYMLIAIVMVALMSTAMKLTWKNSSTFLNTMIFRNLGHFFVNYLFLKSNKELQFKTITKENENLGIIRAFLSSITSSFNNLGVYFLNLGEAFAIRETRPLFNIILNSIYFKERITLIDFTMVSIGITGVILVLQPSFLFENNDFDSYKLTGAIIQFIGNVCGSFSNITLKKIGDSMHTLFVIHFMGIVNIIYFSLAYIYFDEPKFMTLECYFWLLCVGLSSFGVHWYYSRAYQVGDMVLTSMFEFSQSLLGMAIDVLILGKSYNWISYLGVILLGLSLVGAGYFKKKRE